MNQEAFMDWALANKRTPEERFTVEILIDDVMRLWHTKHKTGIFEDWQARSKRERERFFNPAYVPGYSEEHLARAAEVLDGLKSWSQRGSYQQRPIRDVKAFAFFTEMEKVELGACEVADASPLAEMPRLTELAFGSAVCEDFRFLARCRALRTLSVTPRVLWPEVAGLETLQQLETLHLSGNLLALPPGIVWPKVRVGSLGCTPLAARRVADLPRMPACEFLTLSGVCSLEGIEHFPRLRNLTLTGPVKNFGPLERLSNLTCLVYHGAEPRDIKPLTRLPKLHCVSFTSQHTYGLDKAPPRDYLPLTDAPQLRELHVTGCPPVEAEVATLNKVFTGWDNLLLAEKPRPVSAPRLVVGPLTRHLQRPEVALDPGDDGLPDKGMRECEGRWVAGFIERTITAKLDGHADWGKVDAYGENRSFWLRITSFGVVEKLSLILNGAREAIAQLRHDYLGTFMIALEAPKIEPSPAQRELEAKFREKCDKWESENHQREWRERLDRIYRHDLKQQAGEKVNPQEFAAPPPGEYPTESWDQEEEAEDDDASEFGGVAVKKKPDPPPSWLDDEHPLADQYRLMGTVELDEIRAVNHGEQLFAYLMGRQPDLVIPKEESQSN